MGSNRPTFTSPFANGVNPSPLAPSWSNLTPTASTPSSAAGRKRSRDDAASNLEDDYFPVQQSTSAPAPPENEDEWEYGEGMTLIKPSGSGYIISAGSQTGTWAEEKADEEIPAPVATQEKPILRSAKSQRLDFTSTPVIAEEIMSNGTLITPLSASPTNGYIEPAVDDFTRHLGIGWSLISADDDIQAAARGWTKFINNHFPVTDAKIRLQSKGLASYLVEANEGYFLFGEDLKQGRLVSTILERTWVNLRGPVPIFDGEGVMEAGETPKINGNNPLTLNDDLMMTKGIEAPISNEAHDLSNQTLEVEMDMS